MPSLAQCPECGGTILVPAAGTNLEAAQQERIKCPLCQAQFTRQRIQDTQREVPEAVSAEQAPSGSLEPQAAPTKADGAEPQPEAHDWSRFAIQTFQDRPVIDSGQKVSISTGDGESEGPLRAAASKSSAGALKQLAGIVGGGVVGLAVGYLILLLIRGPQGDFLGILKVLPFGSVFSWEAADPDADTPGRPNVADNSYTHPPPVAPPNRVPIREPPKIDNDTAPPAVVVTTPPDLPTPKPEPPGPRNPRLFTSDELGSALAMANSALGCENCNSTGVIKKVVVVGVTVINGREIEQKVEKRLPCEVCGGKPGAGMTQEVYEKLCRLAEIVTFVKVEPGDASLMHRREATQNVMRRAASDDKRRQTMGRLAGTRLDDGGRAGNGIVLAGTVQDLGQEGPLYWTRLVLFGQPKVVTVISVRPALPPLAAEDRVLILGNIIDGPAENVVGYEGQAPQVVWGGMPLKLPDNPQ